MAAIFNDNPQSGLFSRPLRHIKRRAAAEQVCFVPTSSGTGLRRPKLYNTSYMTDFARRTTNVEQLLPRPRSPTRKHRPHPSNVYFVTRLDLRQVVCDVKTEKHATEVDIFGECQTDV